MVPTHPHEYIVMNFIVIFPPIFFYVVNPKLDAIERARKGITFIDREEDAWNSTMPMSKADKRRDLVQTMTFAFVACVFGAFTFSMGL